MPWPRSRPRWGSLSFTAAARDGGGGPRLGRPRSELDNLGFHLYRSLVGGRAVDAAHVVAHPRARLLGAWARPTPTATRACRTAPATSTGSRTWTRRRRSTSHGPVSAVPSAALAGAMRRERSRAAAATKKAGAGAELPRLGARGLRRRPRARTRSARARAARATATPRPCRSTSSRATRAQATLELRTGGFYALHERRGHGARLRPRLRLPAGPEGRGAAAPARARRRRRRPPRAARRRARARAQSASRGLVPAGARQGRDAAWAGTAPCAPAPARGARALAPRQLPDERARALLPSVFQGETKSAVVEITPLRFDARRQQLVLAQRRAACGCCFTGREAGESGRGSLGPSAAARQPDRASGELLARLYTTSRGLYARRPSSSSSRAQRPRRRGVAAAARAQGEPSPSTSSRARRSFGPGSRLYFYADATAASTDFSPEVAYELVRARGGVADAARLGAPPAPPRPSIAPRAARAAFETNRFYQPGAARRAGPVAVGGARLGGDAQRSPSPSTASTRLSATAPSSTSSCRGPPSPASRRPPRRACR